MPGRSVLMMVRTDVAHDARVLREATTLARAGWRVRVLGIWAPGLARRETIDGVEVLRPRSRLAHSLLHRRRTRAAATTPGARAPALRLWLNALASSLDGVLFGLQAALRAGRPDVVHAHDLNVLPAAWLVSRLWRARLVYDTHELHLYSVGMLRMRPGAWRAACRVVERACMRAADAVITVNHACARALARIHGVPRPLALYNAPRLAESAVGAAHSLRAAAGVPAERPLAVYCGGIHPERGIEQAISALALAPGVSLALLGYGERGYLALLRERASAAGVLERLFFVPAVPPAQVSATMRDADVSLVLIQGNVLNYRFSSPNKLVESLHAGLPVIGADLPEIRRVIRAYGCGFAVDARDAGAIAAALRAVTQDAALRARMAGAAREAARRINWENEEQTLLRAYASLTARPARDTAGATEESSPPS
jgi:glycosyltransferase involved in cell wall biosynthesis